MNANDDHAPLESTEAFKCITKELEQYRKKIITLMSEIEEYKRIEHTYSELQHFATRRVPK